MLRTNSMVQKVAERLCRPQRVGVFGHRGVGKTTLLTMLYREAVAGRLPQLRLAAADTRTANYLSEKVTQLESGQPLPATLAETDLRFQLYHKAARIELVVRDYQGEHVELGKQEPVREFLRDCDLVWLCLEAAPSAPADRLRRQQEVEQLVEDYLAVEPQRIALHRPMAIVLTKSDLLDPAADVDRLGREQFGMTRHALQTHCPLNGLFAVSSLAQTKQGPSPKDQGPSPKDQGPSPKDQGPSPKDQGPSPKDQGPSPKDQGPSPKDQGPKTEAGPDVLGPSDLVLSPSPFVLSPSGLAEPLLWLAAAAQAQDEARLTWLWSMAGGQLALLERCTASFAHRYPDASATAVYRQKLKELRRQRFRRRGLTAVAAAALLVAGVWSYDALGHHQAARFEAEHATDPAAVLSSWQTFQTWHPTRHLSGASAPEAEAEQRRALEQQLRQQQCDERLTELRRRAADADVDPEVVWQQFQDFRGQFPEVDISGELRQLREVIKVRRDEHVARRAQRAYDELLAGETRSADLPALALQAERFLRDFGGTPYESEVRLRRDAYLRRIEEREIETARVYSTRQPLNFQTRREHYQRYLDRHPAGTYAPEATSALKAIATDWDRHDFRAVRDHFLAKPGDIPELVALCRTYLTVHPRGLFKETATELLRWTERITEAQEYTVRLRWGDFDSKIAYWLSRGPDLSVELEVAGVRYGPSNIVVNRSNPEWDYEFPRPIRWKLGDPVVIRVTDHDYRKRVVLEYRSEEGDPLAMRMLGGEVWRDRNGIAFSSDFALPRLPKVE